MATFVSDIIKVGASKLVVILSSLISSVITARFIGPEGNGLIASLVVYPSLFLTIGSLGIRQATTFFLGREIFSESQIKTAITQVWILTTTLSMVVCFFLIRYFSNVGDNIWLVFIALMPMPFGLYITYNSGIFLGKNDIGSYNKINWIPSVVITTLMVFFLIGLRKGVEGALWAAVGGPLSMFIILIFRNDFLSHLSLRFNWIIIKRMLNLGLVYATGLFVINLNYRIDVILLDILSTSHELGIYSKGAGITQYLWHIPMLLSTVVFARSVASKDNKQFSIKVAQLMRVSFVLISLASIVLFLCSEFLILTMYGIEFNGSILVLNLLLPGVLILTIFKVMNMDLAGKGRPWASLKAMIPALFINITLNIFLIPYYGAKGAAISSTFSYAFGGLTFMFVYCKETGMLLKDLWRFQKADFHFLFNRFK